MGDSNLVNSSARGSRAHRPQPGAATPPGLSAQRSAQGGPFNTLPMPQISHTASHAASNPPASSPQVQAPVRQSPAPPRWVFGEVEFFEEESSTPETNQQELPPPTNINPPMWLNTMVEQPHTNATPNPFVNGPTGLTQPLWTAQPWHPPASVLASDAIQGTSTNKNPMFQHPSGTSGPVASGDRDRTDPVIQSSQNKTPVIIPDPPKHSPQFQFLNESYIVPEKLSRRKDSNESVSTPGELKTAPESDRDRESMPSASHDDDSEDLNMEQIPPIFRGSLTPTVKADLMSKVQPPWTQHGTSETISQIAQSRIVGSEEDSSPQGDTRVKPAWIKGTSIPAEPAEGFAQLCPLGTYVKRQITDNRYGPASSSTVTAGNARHKPSLKSRVCFVTFQDGPHFYVAPILSAPRQKLSLPFKTRNTSIWDWWLPVTWVSVTQDPKQVAPKTPDHPRELEDGYEFKPDAPFAMPDQPGRRRRIEIEYESSEYELKSCFIWSGDPGDRVTELPQDAKIVYPQVRYLPRRENYEKLYGWWNGLWESGIDPPRPKSERDADAR